MSIWDEAEVIEEPKQDIWAEAELVQEEPVKQQVKTSYTYPKGVDLKHPENVDTEAYKQNIDAIYDIPQVEMPNRGVLTNSNGETMLQGGVKAYDFDNSMPATNKSEHPIREGLLNVGHNVARAVLPKKAENWFIGSKEDEEFLKTHSDENVPTYEQLSEDYNNGAISKDEFIKGLELRRKFNELTYDKEYRDVRNKAIGKGAVEIGSALIPVGAGAKVATKGISLLKPVLGRKGAEFVTKGAIGGATAGALHGAGYSAIDEDLNPVQQIAGDALGWGTAGMVGGAALGAGNKVFRNIKAGKLKQARANKANVKPVEAVEEMVNPYTGEVIEAPLKQSVAREATPTGLSVGRKTKPSKLKSTMQKAGTLPEELNNKPIEYEVINNPDTIAKAQEAIGNDANAVHRDLLKKISGQGDYENYVLSADDVVKARELATKLYQEGNASEAVELTEGIIKAASKTGQALQAYTLWARTTPEGAITYARKIVDRYNKSQHKNLKLTEAQEQEIGKLAEKVQQTTEGTRENEVAIGLMQKYIADLTPASWSKKYDTFRYINMLLSPKSRTKDFLLTGINSADNAIDELIANGIDRVRGLLPNQQRAFNGLRPTEWFNGLKKGFNEGMEDVALNINTSRSGEVGRYGLPKTRSFNYTPLNEVEGGLLAKGKQGLENTLALGEKGLAYTLQVPDRMFYEARYASSLADQMAAAGVKKPTQAMVDQARKEALEAVYQDNSWVSRLGNSTRDAVNNLTGGLENFLNLPENSIPRAGNFIAPFVTTPANIVNIGLKNTFGAPVGLAKLLMAKTPQEIRDAEMLIAKNIKGGLATTGLGLGLDNGLIKTNIGEDRYKDNAVNGLKPQSIIIGDKAFSIKDYPQLSIPANVYMGYREGGLPQAAVNTLNAVGDISALKAVNDTLNAFRPKYAGDEVTGPEIANDLFRSQGVNILTQNIPAGGWLGEIRNDIDPYAREMYMPIGNTTPEMIGNSLQYAGNRIVNRIPVASTLLPYKYNAVGEPVKINNIENPIARVASEAIDLGVRNYNENPVYDELNEFQEKVKDTDIKGRTTVGLNTPSRTIKVNGENVKLDNKQYSDFSHDYTKINYILKGMAVNNEDYKGMTDEEKVEYLSNLRKSTEEAVKMMQYGHEPSRKLHPYTQYILDNYFELVKD